MGNAASFIKTWDVRPREKVYSHNIIVNERTYYVSHNYKIVNSAIIMQY